MVSVGFWPVVFKFFSARCFASGVLKKDKNCWLIYVLLVLGVLSVYVIYQVSSCFCKAPTNFSIFLSSFVTMFSSHVDSQMN